MKSMTFVVSIFMISCLITADAFAGCGSCGSERKHKHASCYGDVCQKATEKGGVKEITYEQFQKIRDSGEKYVLVDALSWESYEKGHIEGAISFPYNTIDRKTARKHLRKKDNIIVYCGGFKCSASTKAAHRLQALGYKNVVDYKGGLEEWQAKGNKLAR